MELANKQCQATLILVCSKDPLMHWRSGRLLTGTCYCLQLPRNSRVDTVNTFTGGLEPELKMQGKERGETVRERESAREHRDMARMKEDE